MRLIFISLVVINIAVAVWGGAFRDRQVEERAALAGQMGVELKSVSSVQVKNFDNTPALPEQQPSKRLCELVGQFDGEESAKIFTERLRSIDIQSSVEHIELAAGSSYWVHLKPEGTPGAAYTRLAELQSLGVESYVIAKGELKNSVSLGVFTQEELAKNKKTQIQGMGFEPIITIKTRTEIEVWVSIQPEYAEKISELTWENLLEGMSSQERRQNFCLPVAS